MRAPNVPQPSNTGKRSSVLSGDIHRHRMVLNTMILNCRIESNYSFMDIRRYCSFDGFADSRNFNFFSRLLRRFCLCSIVQGHTVSARMLLRTPYFPNWHTIFFRLTMLLYVRVPSHSHPRPFIRSCIHSLSPFLLAVYFVAFSVRSHRQFRSTAKIARKAAIVDVKIYTHTLFSIHSLSLSFITLDTPT